MLIRRLWMILLLLFLGTGLSACLDTSGKKSSGEPLTLGISLLNSSEQFIVDMAKTIQRETEKRPNITVIYKNAKGDIALQQKQIDEMLDSGVDGLFVNAPVEGGYENAEKALRHIVLAGKAKDIPLVFFGAYPDFSILDLYHQTFFADSDNPALSAIVQAEILVREWKKHPEWDLNNDGVIQYALLKGVKGNYYAESRSKWIEPTITAYPGVNLRAERVAEAYADWNPDKAEDLMAQWLQQPLNNPIEVVISNNDEMALAAIQTMKKQGKLLPTFGIDGTQDALKAIQTGDLVGSVKNDPESLAVMAHDHMLHLLCDCEAFDLTNANYLVRGHSLLLTSTYLPLTKNNVKQYLGKGSR